MKLEDFQKLTAVEREEIINNAVQNRPPVDAVQTMHTIAVNSDEPSMQVTKDDNMVVIGSPEKAVDNDKGADYTLKFIQPKRTTKERPDNVVEETETDYIIERTFHRVKSVSRNRSRLVLKASEIISILFEQVGGEVILLEEEELAKRMFDTATNAETMNTLDSFVGEFLGLSEEVMDMTTMASVIITAVMIVVNNPSIVNEAERFLA